MASRSLSDQLLLCLPALVMLVLIVLTAMPMQWVDFPLAPNVAWLATLTLGAVYPPAWPYLVAFLLGLLQDVLMGTPLGAQALLTLLLTIAVRRQARWTQHQLFRLRWMEASFLLLVLHFLLWALMQWVLRTSLPLAQPMQAALVNILWFPLFLLGAERLLAPLLPPLPTR